MLYKRLSSKTKIQKNTKSLLVLASVSIFVFFISLVVLLGSVSFAFAESSSFLLKTEITNIENGQEFSSPMPRIFGTAENTDSVLVFIDEKLNGKAKVEDGVFEYYPFLPLSSGRHTVKVVAGYGLEDQEKQVFSDTLEFNIIPNPSPVILFPENNSIVGRDRIWVGGVAKNNSVVIVFVDGVEKARAKIKNHPSGSGSFSAEISGIDLGERNVTAIARDENGKDSFLSDSVLVSVANSTPAPVLKRPVVNSDSGIERPFIVGIAKENLNVFIVIDDFIVSRIELGSDPSGVVSFSWQPEKPLKLGLRKIEAFASDMGKLSNNSKPVFWQVGDAVVSEAKEEISDIYEEGSIDEMSFLEQEIQIPISVLDRTDTATRTVVVREDSEGKPKEIPIIPDVGDAEAEDLILKEKILGVAEKEKGLIAIKDTTDINELSDSKIQETDQEDSGVINLGPGAVMRANTEDSGQEFTFNKSLVIGVIIFIFLLLSIIVWYMQEKKEDLSDRVSDIFREDGLNQESHPEPKKEESSANSEKETKSAFDKNNLPPPPPPMF
jgi:hypothetical protein